VSLDILDVAIGLVFVYLVLSLAVTATNELFAAFFKRRALTLRAGITNLLNNDLAGRLYAHPLIRSLYRGKGGPSYIPSRSFAIALLDVIDDAGLPNGRPLTQDSIARDALPILKREAGGDSEKLKQHVEVWFNDSMERVSGWYKRRTQIFSLLAAAIVTLGSNADTLRIGQALWRDPVMRQATVAQAQRYVAEQPRPETQPLQSSDAPEPPPLPPYEQAQIDFDAASNRLDATRADLQAMQLPIGWRARTGEAGNEAIDRFRLVKDEATEEWPGVIWRRANRGRWLAALRAHSLGWLLTILAISVGAPFWFDMLNKIISIRSVGKAPEESPKPPREVPKPREPGEEA
jgi:hypothetical protein